MLLALLALSVAPAQAPPVDLGRLIDGSVHWLRWSGRNADGSYGKGAEDTAAALAAFAASPRAYRENDGPWVREAVVWLFGKSRADGSIATEGEDPFSSTGAAVAALALLGVEHHPKEQARARGFLLGKGIRPEGEAIPDPLSLFAPGLAGPRLEEATAEEARKAAEPYLQGRGKDGDWGGCVRETAKGVIALSRCHKVIAAQPRPGSPPVPAPSPAPKAPPSRDAMDVAVRKGVEFILKAREKDGLWGFGERSDPGVSALCAAALASTPRPHSPEVAAAIEKTLENLAGKQDKDGAISQGGVASYVTSASILAFVESGAPKYLPNIERGGKFLTAIQCDEGEGYSEGDRFYGGIGYGDDERPDLSNLNFALDALKASGAPASDPALAKALRFLERCQNRSESNPTEVKVGGDVVVAGNDGGAAYFPGNSPAGFVTLPDGRKVARSYGSMTYALLKGFLFAGVPKDDPRMRAAFDWIRKNWTIEENPGFDTSRDPRAGYQGYFYYLYTAARTLRAFGEETVEDAGGRKHDWRAEIASRLLSLQRPDGSWVNEVDRWWEGHPALVTAYALLALKECR